MVAVMREPWKGYFEVACARCKMRRALLAGVLVCYMCDHAEVMPNAGQVSKVPDGEWFVYPGKSDA